MNTHIHELKPIGILHSPFKEKFGIPRQPGLIESCSAEIELYAPYNDVSAVKGLEEFSDIWLIFAFHQNRDNSWRPLIRPPRLGGNKKIGIFASRSPFRPNQLGLSRVALRGIEESKGTAKLIITCPDLVHGTPIYDIKPYIHYADANPEAKCGYAQDTPEKKLEVSFTEEASIKLAVFSEPVYRDLKRTITEVLQYDPRPAYKDDDLNKQFGFKLYDLNIVFTVEQSKVQVIDIQRIR